MNVATRPMMLSGMSEQEWQIRCDLAALYRLVAHHRWTDFVYTHISARLPGPEHHFLINKYGVLFDEMRADWGREGHQTCGQSRLKSRHWPNRS